MNATIDRAMNSYAKVDVEVGVMSASPQALVVMLYDGAIKAIARARSEMLRKDFAAKGEQLSKAIGIIDEGLKAALDLKAGGEIAANLAALYDYMTRQLMLANIRNEVDALDEVSRLLRELKGAWESLISMQAGRAQAQGEAAPPTRSAASYGKA
ncbi:MAG: flagellar export chaperone FliS [Betaproteobacteria bacterium]